MLRQRQQLSHFPGNMVAGEGACLPQQALYSSRRMRMGSTRAAR